VIGLLVLAGLATGFRNFLSEIRREGPTTEVNDLSKIVQSSRQPVDNRRLPSEYRP
jgi:hypothetical protein